MCSVRPHCCKSRARDRFALAIFAFNRHFSSNCRPDNLTSHLSPGLRSLPSSTMDVTKRNFAKFLPEIETNIADCDFFSLDLEFTGLFTAVSNDYLDTHEEFYTKCRNNIDKFQIIQIGISFFKRNTDENFDCHSYNFYIFPNRCQLMSRQKKERYFLCQASSLTFLADNGFDFNKLVREGISYLNLSQEKFVKEKFKEDRNGNEPVIVNNELDKLFIEDIKKQVSDFVNDNEKKELVLPQANAFRRRLIYEAIQNSELNNHLELAVNSSDKQKINVVKCTPEEKAERNRLALLEMVGFTQVVKLLIQKPKPLVGHNMYLDLLYMYNTFIGPLPESYKEFKGLFHGLFPVVYDTRYISSEGILAKLIPNNCLGKLYTSLLEHPFLQTKINLKNSQKGDEYNRHHEAGYDSYITGCCFINIIRYLCAQELEVKFDDILANDIVYVFRNKVGMSKSYDLKYMNMAGRDLEPSRSHVFHITFPKDWKTNNIYNVFHEFGGLCNVTYIDDSTAFCVLKEPRLAFDVVEKLFHKTRSTPYRIQLYSDFIIRSKRAAANEAKKASKKTIVHENDDNSEQTLSPLHKKLRKDNAVDGELIENPEQPANDSIQNNVEPLVLTTNKKPKDNNEKTTNQNTGLFDVPSWNEVD